ncbi:hypothetical protein [Natronolimnohabitans innermongolicus]|uniref:DUF7975 domain-containing protein n=1 Tax=Natronolimnohabitans innermongolicus JCM 12255 TaxID=1227499 RepID=L9XAB0_9EURY|nr:hypothetical protein [Natronolimnohabitans innermongolicus]ELY57533.1 hypothetical protein C493_08606 [Natronolimnohabitans innermongolicus JCM 12255]
MTRFDATEPTKRRKLYVDAITAHRERGSAFLTLEADTSATDAPADETSLEDTNANPAAENGDSAATADGADAASDLGDPWLQFGDGMINLDCTDAELESLKSLLGEFPAFKIDEIHRPDDAAGVNVRISAKADPNRIAQCLDAIFLRVYELSDDVRVWVVEL